MQQVPPTANQTRPRPPRPDPNSSKLKSRPVAYRVVIYSLALLVFFPTGLYLIFDDWKIGKWFGLALLCLIVLGVIVYTIKR